MTKHNPIAMASGIMPEATPTELVYAAADARFDYGGMWIEPDQWTDQTTRNVQTALKETGLKLLDVEVVWIKPGPANPDHLRIIDIGTELRAKNVLVVSSDPNRSATLDKLGLLMERGAKNNIRITLEFGLFTEVKTIHQATSLLHELNAPAAGLLIDSLHWQRSGGTLADISAVPREWLGYAQLCDAPLPGGNPADAEEILAEAIDGRLHLGDGGLPLKDIMDCLPVNLPIAIELRSKALRDQYPDLNDRAKAVARTSRDFFTQYYAQ